MSKEQKDAVSYWKSSSKKDLQIAEELFESKRYNYSLFFLHLSIEKLLKGIFVTKMNEAAPAIHDLVNLAKRAKISLTQVQTKQLEEISKFNIAARYDDYKLKFYKKATEPFTSRWIKNGKSIHKKLYLTI